MGRAFLTFVYSDVDVALVDVWPLQFLRPTVNLFLHRWHGQLLIICFLWLILIRTSEQNSPKKLIWKMKIKQLCVALTGHRTILCALSVYSVSCFSRMTLAMLSSAVLTIALCLFICLTQAGIAPERLNGLRSFLTSRLLAAYTRKWIYFF